MSKQSIEPLVMPRWGLSMEEGTLTQWLVKEGDEIKEGDLVAEIETSKIANELESHLSGKLRRLVADEGDTLPSGDLLAVVAAEDVGDEEIEKFIKGFSPDPELAEKIGDVEDEDGEGDGAAGGADNAAADMSGSGEPDTEQADGKESRAPAEERGAGKTAAKKSPREKSARKKSAGKQPPGKKPSDGSGEGESGSAARDDGDTADGIPATHFARRLAEKHGIDLTGIEGTDRRGRICVDDVYRAAEKAGRSLPPRAPRRARGDAGGGVTEIRPTAMRKTIARRLAASKREAPHYRVVSEMRMDAALALLDSYREDELRVTLNDYLVKAVAAALMQSPGVNVQFDGEVLRRYDDADIAVAVALDDGLITPVVRAANRKSLTEIAAETADLGRRARERRLREAEIEGGTFTISNLGMFEVTQFDAVINPPSSAILAVGRATPRPVVDAGGAIVAATVATMTLSSDHRVIDGAVAARFLTQLKRIVENPGRLAG